MTPTGTRSRLLLAGALWTMVLFALIGFTAEPTTSTQFDAQEGRGVYVVQVVRHQLQVDDITDVVPARVVTPLLALATASLLAGGAALLVADFGIRRSDVIPRAGAARRGPPAIV